MSRTVTLGDPQAGGLRRILEGTDEILGEVADQLPEEDEESTVELDDKHVEFVAHVIDAYHNIYLDDWPDEDEYVDIDLAQDIRERIVDK